MKWQIKFLKNIIFTLLPFPQFLRKIKRRFSPYNSKIDTCTLEQGILQAEKLNSNGYSTHDKILLEIGTGWLPIIPIIFYLSGCKRIITIDTQRLLDRSLLIETIKGILLYKDKISNRLKIPVETIQEKLRIDFHDALNNILDQLSIHYMAPYDITKTNLPNESIDIIVSRAVFEHISPSIMKEIFLCCKRILKINGKMFHIIDNSDHWEHNDKSISRLNYLKFSDITFKLISSFNPLDYQNRLRHFEYISIMKKVGFKIEYEYSEIDKDLLEELKTLNICRKYSNTPHEELAKLTSYIIASKNGVNTKRE